MASLDNVTCENEDMATKDSSDMPEDVSDNSEKSNS